MLFKCCDFVLSRYFEHYFTLSNFLSLAKWKERFSVDLLKFLIFLYIQHAPMISIKTSMVVGEEYPSYPQIGMSCTIILCIDLLY